MINISVIHPASIQPDSEYMISPVSILLIFGLLILILFIMLPIIGMQIEDPYRQIHPLQI